MHTSAHEIPHRVSNIPLPLEFAPQMAQTLFGVFTSRRANTGVDLVTTLRLFGSAHILAAGVQGTQTKTSATSNVLQVSSSSRNLAWPRKSQFSCPNRRYRLSFARVSSLKFKFNSFANVSAQQLCSKYSDQDRPSIFRVSISLLAAQQKRSACSVLCLVISIES